MLDTPRPSRISSQAAAPVAESGDVLLKAVDVTKRYGDELLALDALTLHVRVGEIYALLGASGAGKTTVLHVFMGFVRPTTGMVRVCGTDPSADPVVARQNVTYIAKSASLYPMLTVRQNLEFFSRVDGGTHRKERAEYFNVLRRVGIAERNLERPARDLGRAASLSVWLAVGLMKNTPILLLDEPTMGLDLLASTDLQEALVEFKNRGHALLVATSDVLLAGRIGDRVGIMKEGRKSVELTRDEIMRTPLPQLYLQYMGRPYIVAPS